MSTMMSSSFPSNKKIRKGAHWKHDSDIDRHDIYVLAIASFSINNARQAVVESFWAIFLLLILILKIDRFDFFRGNVPFTQLERVVNKS